MRSAGMLAPISALPNRHGIGDFGKSSYQFVKLLKKYGIKIWQILPLNPIGYGHSPYQPFSSKAMDENYISLDMLIKKGYLKNVPNYKKNASKVSYEEVRAFKNKYLYIAYKNALTQNPKLLDKFIKDEKWVYNYAVFMAIKKKNYMVSWDNWSEEEKNWIKDHKLDLTPYEDEIYYQIFLQYVLKSQWNKLHEFANKLGIRIVGDVPFYVGYDSLDVWENQDCFMLDEERKPTLIAGVPPDYFSKTGQRWGNPIYNWKHLKETNFEFLLDRLLYNAKIFDIIRLDHFRAFDTYYQIESKYETAEIGEWIVAPGYEFFDEMFKRAPHIEIIAEDLGDLRPEVYDLRDHYRFPGMKVIEFTFEDDHLNLTPQIPDVENMVSYISTHDNDTLLGWFNGLESDVKKRMKSSLDYLGYHSSNVTLNFLSYLLNQRAKYAILSLWDVLELNSKSRMNVPGVIDEINWTFRIKDYKNLKNKLDVLAFFVTYSGR